MNFSKKLHMENVSRLKARYEKIMRFTVYCTSRYKAL